LALTHLASSRLKLSYPCNTSKSRRKKDKTAARMHEKK